MKKHNHINLIVDNTPVTNAMTVDVEDYFQVEALTKISNPGNWHKFENRVEHNTNRLLDLYDKHKIKATFFILGWVAEKYPLLIRKIADRGHEIACHSYLHKRINLMSPKEFKADTEKALKLLQDTSGAEIKGYRAPTFSIHPEMIWAYETLISLGFKYSSSTYPIQHDLYGDPKGPRDMFKPIKTEKFVEIPMTTLRVWNTNIPVSGGGYFRLLPYLMYHKAYHKINRDEHRPCIFYFHPWEIDPDQPRAHGLSFKSKFRQYTNLDQMYPKLEKLLKDFSWGRMDQIFLKYPLIK